MKKKKKKNPPLESCRKVGLVSYSKLTLLVIIPLFRNLLSSSLRLVFY